jgi:hypothetical protein
MAHVVAATRLARPGRRPSRVARVAAVVLRLLSLLLATELSGAVHAASDIAASLAGTEHPSDDCDDEQGHECPPGCSSCHCTHGALGSVTPQLALVMSGKPVHRLTGQAGFVPLDAMPPAGPDLTPLYRPPRRVDLS